MRRREFITLLGATAVWPLAARAQPNRVRRIGVLLVLNEGDPQEEALTTAFVRGLQKLGWTAGTNVMIDEGASVSGKQRRNSARIS
jgi:putative tryptophan/tyrosine transport system substrate-binding protein